MRKFIGKREVIDLALLNAAPVIGLIFFGWDIVILCTFLWIEVGVYGIISSFGLAKCAHYRNIKNRAWDLKKSRSKNEYDEILKQVKKEAENNKFEIINLLSLAIPWLLTLCVHCAIMYWSGKYFLKLLSIQEPSETLLPLLTDPIFIAGIIFIFIEQLLDVGDYIKEKFYEVDNMDEYGHRYSMRSIFMLFIIGGASFFMNEIFPYLELEESNILLLTIVLLKLSLELMTMYNKNKLRDVRSTYNGLASRW